MKKFLLLLLAASASAQPVTPSNGTNLLATSCIFANQVFVDGVSGVDGGAGDMLNPFASITYAYTHCPAGYTINVLRGNFIGNNCYVGPNTCHSFYLQSGVVLVNNNDSFLYIDNITNDTVTIEGRGTITGQIAYMGNYGAVNGLTLNVDVGNIPMNGSTVILRAAGINRVDNCSFYLAGDNITTSGNIIVMSTMMTNTYIGLTAKQLISSGVPATGSQWTTKPYLTTIEYTAPNVTSAGVGGQMYNNYIRYIYNRCYLTTPAGTTQSNFFLIFNGTRIRSGGPSATQGAYWSGTTNAWY